MTGRIHRQRGRPSTLEVMTGLAINYEAAERYAEAIDLEEKALALKREHTPHAEEGIIESLENLATCYEKAGREAEAKALREEVTERKQAKESETKPKTEGEEK